MPATAIPADHFDHGDYRRYHRGCTCQPCTNAIRKRRARNKYLRETGRPSLTTAQRAAEHIARLRAAGIDDKTILTTTGIARSAYYRIARGEGRVNRTTEQRILAVQPTPGPTGRNGAIQPGLGTVRRLRALAADGWPGPVIAQHTGRDVMYILRVQASDPATTRVCANVILAVADAYRQLTATTPAEYGVSKHSEVRSRNRAAANGWAGTAYWDEDDYDNPAFDPAVAEDPVWFALAENTLELQRQGMDWQQAAERLGAPVKALRKAVDRYNSGTYATEGWKCNQPGCVRVRKTRGMCDLHYKRAQREAAVADRLEVAA